MADPILTEAQWQSLQGALRKRAKTQPARQRGGATEFLGVLVCADCGTNMTVHRTTVKQRGYAYLRCRNCPSGGLGAPDPEAVYRRLADEVVTALGAEPVRVREYQPGVAGLARPTEGDGLKAEAARGRWVEVRNGDTFRDHWERGGRGVMADDLRRAGITCEVSRHKRPRVRAPEVRLKLTVPEDARERLVVKTDVFADK
ncbi:zinc ribbon domain-containing protein [Streptomyces albidochromogenes]|uniref:zinc ribbon domain-containing protein n=1 Tax=Streptomyces albidochromogenes TaxID=329524 RepID=UPI001FCC019B|nr:zinc ribbon domain-containing protein [Streptomyces albidochromogenes]